MAKVKSTMEQRAMRHVDPSLHLKGDYEQYKLATHAGRGGVRNSGGKAAKPISYSPKK
jgi:hypothetical protein